MKYFLKMVEVANALGVLRDESGADSVLTQKLFDAVEENEVFVFSPTNDPQIGVDSALVNSNLDATKLDAPFKVFSIEMSGDTPLTSAEPEMIERNGFDVRMWCILCVEESPGVYLTFTLTQGGDGIGSRWNILSGRVFNEAGLKIATIYLDRMKKEQFGRESVRQKMKYGTGKNKKFLKINSVVHVSPKKEIGNVFSPRGKVIDWSHRWTVRGHWRDVKGVGKDRDGNYTVNGHTWIASYIKGPDDLPVFKKQRLVEGEIVSHN